MSALNELQNYTFVSKYARWIESENRRETWKEAVDRVKDMMHTQYDDKSVSEDIDWAYDLMLKKRVLGSQRALQFGGDPILKRHAKIYNCTSSYCDRLRFFQECFWLLLCGSGTGFSVQKHHINKLPTLSQNKKDKRKGVKYKIEDSIEGWADSLGVLLSSYFNKPSESRFSEHKDQYIVFDYSNIREKGAQLSSGVGKAPGFEPLQNGLEKIRELLEACVERKRVDTDQHVLLLRFKLLCSVPGSRAARSAARSDVKFNLLTGSLICLTTVILLPRLTTAGT